MTDRTQFEIECDEIAAAREAAEQRRQDALNADITPLHVGDLVEGGQGDDHDTGRILQITGETALVAWQSGVRTQAFLSDLRLAV